MTASQALKIKQEASFTNMQKKFAKAMQEKLRQERIKAATEGL